MGKEPGKEQIYVWLNHSAVYLKLTQHCKSTIYQYKILIFFNVKSFKKENIPVSFFFKNRGIWHSRSIVHIRLRLITKEDFCSKISFFS